MSTTQIPPPVPPPPPVGSGRDASDLYDAKTWESAYRELHDAPALLIQLQDELSTSRKREAFWISVAVHLILIIFIVNLTRFTGWFPKPSVLVTKLNDKDATYLELPPDLEKAPTKRPDTDKISDKDRVAMSKSPQINREQLKKILESGRVGRPNPSGAPQQAQQNAQPAPQNQTPPQSNFTPPPPDQNQTARLQQPPAVQPKPSFNIGGYAGNITASAANAAAANRGGYAGDSGDYGTGNGRPSVAHMGPVDILSDTMGVDFGPYLQRVLHDVKINWYNIIPEVARPPLSKKGTVVIEFAITKDGKVAGMKLDSTSGDTALDRGAWGGITASNPFPPLPTEFGGQYLLLRFKFLYNYAPGEVQ